MKQHLKSKLEQIAGKNVLNGDNQDIANLVKCCNYLAVQLDEFGKDYNEEIDGTL